MLEQPIPAIKICTAPHAVYVAHLVDHALKKLGIESCIQPDYIEDDDNGELHIIVCPSYFEKFPRNYIVYQLEQLENSRFYNDSYKRKLENALAVLDYSKRNVDFLVRDGFPSQKINLLKISCFPIPAYKDYLFRQGLLNSEERQKDVDILFYGNSNVTRRKLILSDLNDQISVTSVAGLYGRDVYDAILRSKIVLNLHFYDNALLEVVRIFESLSLGVPVVSEESQDISEYSGIDQVVDFFPLADINICIKKMGVLLDKKEQYKNKIASIENYCSNNDKNFVEDFRKFLQKFFPNTTNGSKPSVETSLLRKAFTYRKFRTKTACIAIAKNEENYIQEWIAHQFAIGFDVVVVLDNNSDDQTKDNALAFKPYFDVRVLDWKITDPDYQLKAYDFVVQEYNLEFEWMAFFDTDEFLIFSPNYDLHYVLSERTDADGIVVPWSVFGSSGYLTPPLGLTSENFLYRSEANFGPNRHVKSIVRPNRVKGCLNPHVFDILGSYRHLDGQEVAWQSPGIVVDPPSYKIAKLNHYFTRSFAEWEKKMARGYHDIKRQISDFEAYDRNEVYDNTALSTVSTVKQILKKMD